MVKDKLTIFKSDMNWKDINKNRNSLLEYVTDTSEEKLKNANQYFSCCLSELQEGLIMKTTFKLSRIL